MVMRSILPRLVKRLKLISRYSRSSAQGIHYVDDTIGSFSSTTDYIYSQSAGNASTITIDKSDLITDERLLLTVETSKLYEYLVITIKMFHTAPSQCMGTEFFTPELLRQKTLDLNINQLGATTREQCLFPDITFTCNGAITKWIVGVGILLVTQIHKPSFKSGEGSSRRQPMSTK